MVGERRAHQLAAPRRGIAWKLLVRVRTALQIHAPRHQIAGGHPVGQCVMDLADDGDATVGQALDEVHLPQWAVTVQRRAGNLADRLVELAAAARFLQPPRANVVVQVDVAVLPPHRVMELERDRDELIAERIKLVESAPNDVAELLDTEGAATEVLQLDDRHLEGVHMDVRRLAVQQDGIPATQSLHRFALSLRPSQSGRYSGGARLR